MTRPQKMHPMTTTACPRDGSEQMRERRTSVRARDRRDRQDHGPGACGGPGCGPAAGPYVGHSLYESRKLKEKKRKEKKRSGVRFAGAPRRGHQAAPRARARPTAAGTMVPVVPAVPWASRVLLRSRLSLCVWQGSSSSIGCLSRCGFSGAAATALRPAKASASRRIIVRAFPVCFRFAFDQRSPPQ